MRPLYLLDFLGAPVQLQPGQWAQFYEAALG